MANTEKQRMPAFSLLTFYPPAQLIVDPGAYNILRKCGISELGVPYKVESDGGCLFESLSVSLIGDQTLSQELRVRTCIEMIYIKDTVIKLSVTPNLLLVFPNYISSVYSCAKPGGFSSIWTIFALSNVIGLPLESIYPPMNGTSNRPFKILNMLVVPQIPSYHSRQIRLRVYKKGDYWYPDHFVPILPSTYSVPTPTKHIHSEPMHNKKSLSLDSLDEFPPPATPVNKRRPISTKYDTSSPNTTKFLVVHK